MCFLEGAGTHGVTKQQWVNVGPPYLCVFLYGGDSVAKDNLISERMKNVCVAAVAMVCVVCEVL